MPGERWLANATSDARREGALASIPIPTTRVAPVSETLHGATFEDPYRWLEDDSAEMRAWTAAQNAYSAATLGALPGRATLRERLAALLGAGYVMTPKVKKGK